MPTLDELDIYYQTQYRTGTGECDPSPYEDTADLNFRTLSQVEYLRSLGIEPRSIVDVGCGFGLLLNSLRKVFPHARLFGVEISKKCHSTLSHLGIEQAHVTLEMQEHNPFDESFDLLVCSHVLEHSGDVPQFLSVCHEMVRPGGTVLFEVPNCEHEYGNDAPHVVFFTPETLQRTLERSGFNVKTCQACGPSIERWTPSKRQQLRNCLDDHLPPVLSRGLRTAWHTVKGVKRHSNTGSHHTREALAKLKAEAKDEAWFWYNRPGFKHAAIRCVAIRNS